MDNSQINKTKEAYLRDLRFSAKLYKPLLIIGLVLLFLAIIIFATNDMAYISSGFLGLPTVKYTGAFWISLASFLFGMFCLVVTSHFKSAKDDLEKSNGMTDEEFVHYIQRKRLKTAAKAFFKFFGS